MPYSSAEPEEQIVQSESHGLTWPSSCTFYYTKRLTSGSDMHKPYSEKKGGLVTAGIILCVSLCASCRDSSHVYYD